MRKDSLTMRIAAGLAIMMVFAFALSRFSDWSFWKVVMWMGSLLAMFGLTFWVSVKLGILDRAKLKDRKFSKNDLIYFATMLVAVAVHMTAFKFLEKEFDWFSKTKIQTEIIEKSIEHQK